MFICEFVASTTGRTGGIATQRGGTMTTRRTQNSAPNRRVGGAEIPLAPGNVYAYIFVCVCMHHSMYDRVYTYRTIYTYIYVYVHTHRHYRSDWYRRDQATS